MLQNRWPSEPAAVHYRIGAQSVHAHLWEIRLRIAKPKRGQIVSLPVWIAGSYMVREFSKHLQNLYAEQAGQACKLTQLDKSTWKVQNTSSQALLLRYEVYAFDASVRTAWLDAQRAFFNPSSLCLRVHGQEKLAHGLSLDAINLVASCAVSTSVKPQKSIKKLNPKSLGDYLFEDYDHLVDTPFEIGQFWRERFKRRGATHEFVVSGASPSFDGARLLADTQKIVDVQMQFWHGSSQKPPFDRYVFMLNAVNEGYGGLEHRASTALMCGRRNLPRLGQNKASEGYTGLLGLISHEYFHTWNVKRLKPEEFLHYDYSRENYSTMLWFFEGFTSYYDDLLLRRAQLIDTAQYLKLLAQTINQVQQTPGQRIQSVAQASLDARIKYYRNDENTPNATVSYYSKGALVALCFDLSLRRGGQGARLSSLDEVMRLLWTSSKAALPGHGGITEADFAGALQQCSGRSYLKEIATWVHSTADLPIHDLSAAHGVQIVTEHAANLPMAQRLGLRVNESGVNLTVTHVLRGSLAERAGIAAGDEWLAVDDWRPHKLEDISLLCGRNTQTWVTVSRDKKILRLPMPLPQAGDETPSSLTLRCSHENLVHQWLLG